MCGISGFITFNSELNCHNRLKSMTDLIVHRGPDGYGHYIDVVDNCTIAMGMRRLSIIDLKYGDQPIFSRHGDKVIVFNGEIYNYQLLRNLLISKGYMFKTNSDTEVILNLYEEYGVLAFAKLDGMFAFSIYDKSIGKVFIARDYFGEKPLYYTHNADGFIWASELKSIINVLPYKPDFDKISLSIYFQTTYIPAPHTIYNGIYKLEANHFIELDCSTNKYLIHNIEYEKQNYDVISLTQSVKQVHELVRESVRLRSISDVPIGTFLSGGVDSSIVSLCLAQQTFSKIDTFSIGFEKKDFDESDKARLVSKVINSNHHEFILAEKDLVMSLEEILLNFDEPFADSSALPTFFVSKKTREHVKVALTGDGGDEVFGGYNKYYASRINQKYTSVVPRNIHTALLSLLKLLLRSSSDNRGLRFKINRLLDSIDYEGSSYFSILSLGFQDVELESFINSSHFKSNSLDFYKKLTTFMPRDLNDFRSIDKILSLEGDMLVKVDRTSMLASLECRAPFLNRTLWDFTSQLPENFLVNGVNKKFVLKEAFREYFPKDFFNKPKKGFGVPVGDWLKSSLRPEVISFVDTKFLIKQNIFNVENAQRLIHNHLSGKQDNSFRVWTFYCFQKWYRHIYER